MVLYLLAQTEPLLVGILQTKHISVPLWEIVKYRLLICVYINFSQIYFLMKDMSVSQGSSGISIGYSSILIVSFVSSLFVSCSVMSMVCLSLSWKKICFDSRGLSNKVKLVSSCCMSLLQRVKLIFHKVLSFVSIK